MEKQVDILVSSLRQFWEQLASLLPNVIAAVFLLTAGWLVAKLVRKATIRLLRLLRVDVIAEKSGIEDFLLRGNVKFTTVTLLGSLVYWIILFTVVLAVLNSMGLEVAAQLFNRIILYLPNVVVAVIVLIFGTQFARFVQGIAFTYLSNVGIAGAEAISLIAQYALLFFVVSVALEQLQIGGQILISAFQIAFGALCLALALAFGLGGREWAGQVLSRLTKK
ncbi:MAG: hypothetical protein HBSIN02_05660 [Bacteroidia bacterium]|nr:MAG: hypothetical protein HBSIN02_05660 [Bacteroidia bacterium]